MRRIRRLLARIAPGRGPIAVMFVLALVAAPIGTSGLVVAQTVDPEFEAIVPEPVLEPGTTSSLTVQLVNQAGDPDDATEPARNVRATLLSNDTPISVRSGTRAIGDIPADGMRDTSFRITVPADIEPGTYDLAVRVRYDHGDGVRNTTNVTATVRVEDRARFEIIRSDSNVSIGDTGPIAIDVRNVGTEPARDAAVTVESASGAIGFDGAASTTRFAGNWSVGETKTVIVDAAATETAEARSYPLRATVAYDTMEGTPATSRTLSFGVTPRPEQSFDVRNVESTLSVGSKGDLTGTIVNDGPDPVRNAVVTLQTGIPSVEFLQTEYAIGDIRPGETANFSFEASVADAASSGPRQFSAVVRYRDGNGDRRQSESLDVPAPVGPEQTFSIRNVTSSLRVGEEGTLSGELENTAETTVSNAVVVFTPDSETVHPVETEVAVGDLDPGERVPFSFDVDVSESAGAGERQFAVDVRYRDRNDEVRRSDPIDVAASVAPKRERFAVDSLNTSIQAGADGEVTLRVTNRGDEPLSDVSAKLFASSPISTTDDESFVQRLAPGESAELIFGVGVADDANAKVYPLSIDFQYDTPDGDTELSETYRVALRVQESEGSSFPTLIVVGLVAILAVLAVGAFLYRRF